METPKKAKGTQIAVIALGVIVGLTGIALLVAAVLVSDLEPGEKLAVLGVGSAALGALTAMAASNVY